MSNNQLPPQLPPEAPHQYPNYQPQYQPNQNWNYPRPPKKGTSVWKVLLIVFACLIGFGVIVNMCDDGGASDTQLASTSNDSTMTDKDNKKSKSWELSEKQDEMTDKMTYYASIISDNRVKLEFPYDTPLGSELRITIRKSSTKGTDVYMQISRGQMLSSDFGNNKVSVRFDDAQPIKYSTSESSTGESEVLFIRNTQDFIKRAKTAKRIKVEVPFFEQGNHIFSYELDEPLKWEH